MRLLCIPSRGSLDAAELKINYLLHMEGSRLEISRQKMPVMVTPGRREATGLQCRQREAIYAPTNEKLVIQGEAEALPSSYWRTPTCDETPNGFCGEAHLPLLAHQGS
jgi:hypothetical protein